MLRTDETEPCAAEMRQLRQVHVRGLKHATHRTGAERIVRRLAKAATSPRCRARIVQREGRPGARHAAGAVRRGHLFELVRVHGIRQFRRPGGARHRAREVPQELDPIPLLRRSAAMLRGGVHRRRARRRGPAPAGFANGRAPSTRPALHRRAARSARRPEPDRHRGSARPGAAGSGRDDGAHAHQRLRGLAARSALHVRELRRRSGQPHGACRRHPGRRDRIRRGARLQSALPSRQRRARQDASPACHCLGGEAARAQGQRALLDGRALPLPVRRGHQEPGRDGLQGQVPADRHPADRRPRVHARREDRAGVRAHHQPAARRRPAGGGGLGPAAGAARRPQRPHALAPAARPRHRDQPDGCGAAAQGAGEAGAGEAGGRSLLRDLRAR